MKNLEIYKFGKEVKKDTIKEIIDRFEIIKAIEEDRVIDDGKKGGWNMDKQEGYVRAIRMVLSILRSI